MSDFYICYYGELSSVRRTISTKIAEHQQVAGEMRRMWEKEEEMGGRQRGCCSVYPESN